MRAIPDVVLDAWERGDRREVIAALVHDGYDVSSSVAAIERQIDERNRPISRLSKALDALHEIAAEDYRGPRPPSAAKAEQALYEIAGCACHTRYPRAGTRPSVR